jgi:hypothetical protein
LVLLPCLLLLLLLLQLPGGRLLLPGHLRLLC